MIQTDEIHDAIVTRKHNKLDRLLRELMIKTLEGDGDPYIEVGYYGVEGSPLSGDDVDPDQLYIDGYVINEDKGSYDVQARASYTDWLPAGPDREVAEEGAVVYRLRLTSTPFAYAGEASVFLVPMEDE